MMLLKNQSFSHQSMILLFSIFLNGFHFKDICYSINLNPNIFIPNYYYFPFSVPLLQYHQFLIFILGKLNFLRYAITKDMVYDNLTFSFTLFENSF